LKTIIYHDDNDGRLAAAILTMKLKKEEDPLSVVFIPATYDKAEEIVRSCNEKVYPEDSEDETYIVDFSFPLKLFARLVIGVPNVVWIDHHKSSIEALADAPIIKDLPGMRDTKRAACILTWEYCFPGKEVPLAVQLVADRDAWIWEFGEDTAAFYYGLSRYKTDPNADIWKAVLGHSANVAVGSIKSEGRIVMGAIEQRFRDIRETVSFETIIDGYETLAMNIAIAGSAAFGADDWATGGLPDVEICCQYYYNGKVFTVSMYSPKGGVDVSELCKKRGGGGHANAAGFTSVELPDFLRSPVKIFRGGS